MKKIVSIVAGVLVASINLSAQQTPISNFYNFNEYLLNPSEAGANNQMEGTVSHRIQWQGIEGAPTTTFFGMHGALNDKMGIGARVTVDQTDILKQFNAALSYAYRIKLNDKANLSFGLSGLLVQNSVGYGNAVVGDLADDVVNGGDESGVAFDAEAGMLLQYQKFRLGVSSANLFESGVGYNLPDDRGEGTFERVRQFSAYTSYEFELAENWKLEPFILLRNQGVKSFQYEVNALTTWKNTLHVGFGYRQEAGMIGRVGFQITDQIVAAYAYEMGTAGVASYSAGSHEFMLGLKIGKRATAKEALRAPLTENRESDAAPIVEVEAVAEKVIPEVKKENSIPQPKEETKLEEIVTPEKVKIAFKKDIKFEFESAAKENSSIPQNESLDEIADYLTKNRSEKVLIKGHTCNMGNDEVNTRYSLQRANTVKQYLLKKGVLENQMELKAMRDTEPLVPNTSIENRKQNRRVEIRLIR